MIEVEKKFSLSQEQLERIEKTAEFVKEVENTDVYYDTSDYKLTSQDIWLRIRNGKPEVKIPPKNKPGLVNVYDEVDNPDEIIKKLNLKHLSDGFIENLEKNGFKILLNIKTHRRKFKLRDFTVDIDEVDYGYKLCEIEKLVENESEVEKAIQEILDFARSLGLEIKYVRGKGMEYFYRFNKDAYEIASGLNGRIE